MKLMLPTVVAFSGRIGSGKTTLCKAVATQLGWPYTSFGEYVRRIARERGLDDTSRSVLQDVGLTLIAAGWDSFCQGVLDDVGWKSGTPLLLDGIRHLEALQTLRRLVSPLDLMLVYIDVSDSVRSSRLAARQHGLGDLGRHEEHSTERQVATLLRSKATTILDGSLAVEELAGMVVAAVAEKVSMVK